MGFVTFISFLSLGIIPLIIYVIDYTSSSISGDLFLYSSVLTFVTFAGIGFAKSYVTQANKLRSTLETLFLGGSAAVLAYFVGDFLEKMIA